MDSLGKICFGFVKRSLLLIILIQAAYTSPAMRVYRTRAGDVLILVNGDYVIVEFIQHEILESPQEVYNLSVRDYHTYFVTGDGLLVHNSCNHNKEWNNEYVVAMKTSNSIIPSIGIAYYDSAIIYYAVGK